MRERAGRGHDEHEADIAPGPETARQRRAERQQPSQIEAEMEEIGVNEGVGEEGPQIGAEAAGKRSRRR